MIAKLKKLKNIIIKNNKELLNHKKTNEDIYALGVLQPLMNGYPYIPLNGGALRPLSAAYILNEIVINRREQIIEFGSGISTILIGRLIKKNKLKTRLVSVEHNKEWSEVLKNILSEEELSEFVTVLYIDLKKTITPFGEVKWYEVGKLKQEIKSLSFDMVIIDGPPANEPKLIHSRYPGLEIMKNYLKDDYCIILDDVNRNGEKDILDSFISKNKGLNPIIIGHTMAVIRNQVKFNPIPIYYTK